MSSSNQEDTNSSNYSCPSTSQPADSPRTSTLRLDGLLAQVESQQNQGTQQDQPQAMEAEDIRYDDSVSDSSSVWDSVLSHPANPTEPIPSFIHMDGNPASLLEIGALQGHAEPEGPLSNAYGSEGNMLLSQLSTAEQYQAQGMQQDGILYEDSGSGSNSVWDSALSQPANLAEPHSPSFSPMDESSVSLLELGALQGHSETDGLFSDTYGSGAMSIWTRMLLAQPVNPPQPPSPSFVPMDGKSVSLLEIGALQGHSEAMEQDTTTTFSETYGSEATSSCDSQSVSQPSEVESLQDPGAQLEASDMDALFSDFCQSHWGISDQTSSPAPKPDENLPAICLEEDEVYDPPARFNINYPTSHDIAGNIGRLGKKAKLSVRVAHIRLWHHAQALERALI